VLRKILRPKKKEKINNLATVMDNLSVCTSYKCEIYESVMGFEIIRRGDKECTKNDGMKAHGKYPLGQKKGSVNITPRQISGTYVMRVVGDWNE